MNPLSSRLPVRGMAPVFRAESAIAMVAYGCRNLCAQAALGPIVLTGADRRPAISLNGEWASIVDPYFSGLFSFHHEEKRNGWFLNHKAKPGDPFPTEYDFSKAPKLKVPGRLEHAARVALLLRGADLVRARLHLSAQGAYHVFLHVGAANYHSWFWVNGKKVCEHEGGYTASTAK